MKPPFSPRLRALFVWLLMTAVLAPAARAYTPPSPPPKYWDYFTDNYFTLANRSANVGALVITNAGATQATTGNTAFSQQYQVLANLEDWTYRIINRESGLCLAPLNNGTSAGTSLAAAVYTGAANQKWQLTGTGGGYWAFVHAATGLALQTNGGNPASVTLQAVNSALTTQQWLADPGSPTDHFPKKGQAGWDGTAWNFQPNWLYNWSASQPNLPGKTTYIPMRWGQWWPGTNELGGGYNALHSTARAVSILTFNEPDHTDQANMNTDQAIDRWPELQGLNVPLGSPATASTWQGWMGDFYNKIGAKGYRVDFTAIHNYPTDPWHLNEYLNNVNSVAGTWNRPVWITEFALTGWGGYVSWTEENCFTWLAEFLWRAEDYPNLRRYSYYPYANDPPANPWNPIGTGAGGLLKGDSSTLTALGELYAAWDADRTIRPRVAYLLQGKQSMMRLSSNRANSPFPGGQASYLNSVSIRYGGAQAQWALVASPTAGQYYICSLLDGRRLQTDGSLIVFAPPGTTGGDVQWSVGGDSAGYFFINNPTRNVTLYSHRDNDGNGAPTNVYYGVVASGSPTDFTRFRLVKPFGAVTVPTNAPAAPTALTVTPGDRRNVLRWSGAGAYYTVARATSPAGPFTTLATNWPNATYVDNAAANGVTYYYTVTASNLLADTSSATAAVSGLPAAALAVADLEGNYKFEAGNVQDNSGNNAPGSGSGDAPFFAPGKVDGNALNFNGVNASALLPAVVANDFTVAFWMRTTTAGPTGTQWWQGDGLADAEVGGAAADWGVALLGTKVAFGVGNPDTTILSTGAVTDGAWHLVAATRNNANGAMALYIDGALQASGLGPAGTRAAPTGIRLGASLTGANATYFKGDLDEVRLYSYILGSADVTKLATASANALVAQYPLDNNLADTGGLGNQGGGTGLTYAPGKTGSAAVFDGTTSFATVPQSLTNDFTISFWLKTTSSGFSGAQWWQGAGLVDGETPGAGADFGVSLLGGRVAFGVGGTADKTILSTGYVNDGAWHHVAATRVNGNGAMRLYIDGALQATDTGSLGARTAPTALSFGRILSGYNYFAGSLDDVRLYNYALPAGQVQSFSYPAPAPWTLRDIGNPAAGGYTSYQPAVSNGAWTVGGSGGDIWGQSDQFAFASTTVTGAGTLVARMTATPTNPDGTTTANAKAGLMWRDGLAANAAFVDLVFDVGQGLQLISRAATGAAAVQSFPNRAISGAPFWLKLTRGGDYIQAFYSTKAGTVPPTASEWIILGGYTLPMNSGNVQAGLAVTSHADGTLASAAFDSLALQPNTAPTVDVVADQTLAENSSYVSLPVTVGDAESPPNTLALSVTTSNPVLVPPGNISLGGVAGARTVQFAPAANQSGAATLTLSVSDGQAATTTSFVVNVTTTAAGGWRQRYFGGTSNAGQGADGANPAGDGITNFFKRAFGLDPLTAVANPAAAWPQTALDAGAGTLGLSYTRATAASAPDLAFQVLWSRDLQNWSATGVTDAATGPGAAADTEAHKATVPLTLGSPIFLKLQITRSP